jgi:hypothetical protein
LVDASGVVTVATILRDVAEPPHEAVRSAAMEMYPGADAVTAAS